MWEEYSAGKGESMQKIAAMYRWSGGTDYRHTCFECRNLIKVKAGKRTCFKCLAYGNTESSATDWKASYIACKYFGKEFTGRTIFEREQGSRVKESDDIPGQMSIADFGI